MQNTRIAGQTRESGAPLTDAELEQARYALRELARSEGDPEAVRVSPEQLDVVRSFFELGWAMGVRTGHTGPAMTDVPVDRATVDHAFVELLSARVAHQLSLSVARLLDPQDAGPVLWQRVRYHGSLTQHHGLYWVRAIKVEAGPEGAAHTVRYDLCEVIGGVSVPAVTHVRRQSVTPLPEFRAPSA